MSSRTTADHEDEAKTPLATGTAGALYLVVPDSDAGRALGEAAWSLIRAHDPHRVGEVVPFDTQVLRRWTQQTGESQAVVFLDSPAVWPFEAGRVGEFEFPLDRWMSAASALLAFVRAHRQGVKLIDAREARRSPHALLALLGCTVSGDASQPTKDLPRGHDGPVEAFLAEAIIRQDRQANRLWTELLAMTEPLEGDPDVASSTPSAAWSHHLASHRHGVRAPTYRLREQATPGIGALVSSPVTDPAPQTQVDQLVAQQELLLLQVQQLTHELDRQTAVADEAKQALSKLQQQQAHSEAASREARHVRETLGLVEQRLELTAEQSAEQADALERSRQELERLRLQMADVRATTDWAIQVSSAELIEHASVPPHRHLGLRLHGVAHAGRFFGQLDVRLVEHHGAPGLLLFSNESPPWPLSAWDPQGNDSGRAFELLIPADTHGQERLARLGSADWMFILSIATQLQAWTRHLSGELADFWQPVAVQLVRQLHLLPVRLRYDGVTVNRRSDQSFDIRIAAARLGSCAFGDLQLRLEPEPVRLSWGARHEGGLPLLGATSSPAIGEPERHLLALGPSLAEADKRLAWASWMPMERELIQGVIDALAHTAASSLRDPALASAADTLARDLRMQARAVRRRQQLRRLLGRRRTPRSAAQG